MSFLIIFSMILICFSLTNSSINLLILIEFMTLTILNLFVMNYLMNEWIFLMYLIMSVCDAVIGLSIMVSMNFTYGHSNIKMMNLCVY